MKIKKNTRPRNNFFVAFFFFFSFSSSHINAQNILERQISSKGVTEIIIDGNQIFNIEITTSKTKEIKLLSKTDGEYQNDFQIASEVKTNQLFLRLSRVTFSERKDNKRNAHKVIAAVLKIEIPENLSVSLNSDIGSATIQGKYKNLNIQLSQGNAMITALAKMAIINSIDGDITVKTNKASIEGKSNHGTVKIDSILRGSSLWKLNSIHGSIKVAQIE